MNNKRIYLIIFAVVMLFLFSCKSFLEKTAVNLEFPKYIRVLLTYEDDINIGMTSSMVVKDYKTNEIIIFKKNIKNLNIKNFDNKTYMNNEEIINPVIIYDMKNYPLKINKKIYFGTLKIIPAERFSIINQLSLDLYLLSVVPSEVPVSFALEALKAQVIIARTYAYLFIKKYEKRREFDVDDTTRYQVYKGYNIFYNNDNIKKVKRAIDETHNQFIGYKDEPILAYFHANSGGKIRSGASYFGAHSNFPYLPSMDDPYSLSYPGSSWEYEVSLETFKNTINISEEVKVEQIASDQDGLLEHIKIENKTFTARDLRKAFGYAKVKSERFKITIKPDEKKVIFSGSGYGHGVGLSQWGAQGMALHGIGYRDIIFFYYPGTEIKYFQDEN